MPTYGYQCTACKHQFQVFQSMKDDPISLCPECEGAVKRLLYPVGVVFKGSGWYITDSRGPEKTEGSETKPETTTETKSDTTSDTKKPAPSTPSESKTETVTS